MQRANIIIAAKISTLARLAEFTFPSLTPEQAQEQIRPFLDCTREPTPSTYAVMDAWVRTYWRGARYQQKLRAYRRTMEAHA